MSDAKPRELKRAVLYCDTRLGEIDQWVYGDPADANMRLPEQIKECLGFLVTRTTGHKKKSAAYHGTAFFVGVPSETDPGGVYQYLVTAKHVLEEAGVVFEKGVVTKSPTLYLRLNTKDGGRDDIKLAGAWIPHDDESVDLAVLPIGPPEEDQFEAYYLPYQQTDPQDAKHKNMLADEAVVRNWRVGIGDEIRIVGPFTEHTGERRNEPIVRAGIISAMPQDKVVVKEKGVIREVNAYIAEVRSIGGLSGSPVYVALDTYRQPNRVNRHLISMGYRLFLLGLVRGHWYDQQEWRVVSASSEPVNMGMALVTPVTDLLTLLLGDKMKEQRKRDDEETPRRSNFTSDSARSRDEGVKGEGVTREGFEEALRRASRKTPSADEEKGGT